ncbi:hypothetical protein O6H91_05G039500 [Diphasiastrum complanatum]|uniref:Uncharacterized protein n=1 Tax=Diphasiastrum complanatum TaxID=34168 RepID=A0ACC2DN98_DIPCM|nr:hypothetical protein O6H91_05G039500 [Diphasiastrum complanatum]
MEACYHYCTPLIFSSSSMPTKCSHSPSENVSVCKHAGFSASTLSSASQEVTAVHANLSFISLGGALLDSRLKRVIAKGRFRSAIYEDIDTYVLIEPGQDEEFVSLEELKGRLHKWLKSWPTKELPLDLSRYDSLEEAVEYLVRSVCELDLGGGLGSVQWFEVRLE